MLKEIDFVGLLVGSVWFILLILDLLADRLFSFLQTYLFLNFSKKVNIDFLQELKAITCLGVRWIYVE